jgi:peroxiredoxin
VWHAWGLDAYNIARPAVFLIDRQGTIHYSFIASRQSQYPSPHEVTRAIEEMLNVQ